MGRYHLVLAGPGFTPNLDADQHYSDIGANELYEGDWPQGGKTITGVAVTLDTANDRIVALSHDQVDNAGSNGSTFASPGATQAIWVDWASGANAATRRLAFTVLLDHPLTPVAGPVVFTSPNGVERSGY